MGGCGTPLPCGSHLHGNVAVTVGYRDTVCPYDSFIPYKCKCAEKLTPSFPSIILALTEVKVTETLHRVT